MTLRSEPRRPRQRPADRSRVARHRRVRASRGRLRHGWRRFGRLCGLNSAGGVRRRAARHRPGVSAQATSLGVILVDGQGRTVYEFANDTNALGMHRGVRDQLAARRGAVPAAHVAARSDRTARRDHPRGRTSQLTVAGHPLYTFAGDTAPGQTKVRARPSMAASVDLASAAGAPVANANRPPPRRQPRSLPATEPGGRQARGLPAPPEPTTADRSYRSGNRCDPRSSPRHPSPDYELPDQNGLLPQAVRDPGRRPDDPGAVPRATTPQGPASTATSWTCTRRSGWRT